MDLLSLENINSLRRSARSVIRELGLLNDAYFAIGVTLAERHLLIELANSPLLTMKQIAERLLLDKSTISRLIAQAMKKKYISSFVDENDKRKRLIQMTSEGYRILRDFEPIAFDQTKRALSTLRKEEIEIVYQGIALYAKGLKNARNKETLNAKEMLSAKRGCAATAEEKTIDSFPKIIAALNEMGYRLRLFESQDEGQLYAIFREVVDTGSQFPYRCNSIEEFRHHFFTPQSKVYVCSTWDGKVIGGFYLRPNFTGKSSHIGNAAYMIDKSFRGKGLGSLLIMASLHLAKELGLRAMQFNMVLSKNTLAIKLYQKLGFAIVGNLPEAIQNEDGSYQDGYVMYRKLNDLP